MKTTVWVKEYKEDELSSVPGIAGRFKRYVDSKDTGERLIHALGRLEPGEASARFVVTIYHIPEADADADDNPGCKSVSGVVVTI